MPFDLREFLSEIILTSRTLKDGYKSCQVLYLSFNISKWGEKLTKNRNQVCFNMWHHTFPTAEKNSSRSLGLILAASCMQNTVRASLSSGLRLSIGCLFKETHRSSTTETQVIPSGNKAYDRKLISHGHFHDTSHSVIINKDHGHLIQFFMCNINY